MSILRPIIAGLLCFLISPTAAVGIFIVFYLLVVWAVSTWIWHARCTYADKFDIASGAFIVVLLAVYMTSCTPTYQPWYRSRPAIHVGPDPVKEAMDEYFEMKMRECRSQQTCDIATVY